MTLSFNFRIRLECTWSHVPADTKLMTFHLKENVKIFVYIVNLEELIYFLNRWFDTFYISVQINTLMKFNLIK